MATDLVPRVPSMSRKAIEKVSRDFIEKTGNSYLLNNPGPFPAAYVFEFIDEYYPNLRSGVENLGDRIEGEARPDGTILLCESTWRGLQAKDGRCRNTAIHEIGHGIMHCPYLQQALLDGVQLHRKQPRAAYECPEWQARYFSSAVLMPKDAVKALLSERKKGTLIPLKITMASVFHVSYRAAEVRLDILKCQGLI